ncbi:MAG TPA: HPr family phosphocarrier protein [Clostridiales bacterium]|nr:HPr family phosphocarrier protein [Clostridiales bacterium]
MKQSTVKVRNKDGLHARPAAEFVQMANKFNSEIWIEKDNKKVSAKSIMGVMSLGISTGTQITLVAQGEDENDALKALVEFVTSNPDDKS